MNEPRRPVRSISVAVIAALLSACGIDRGGAPLPIGVTGVTGIADAIDDAIVGPIASKGDEQIVVNNITISVRDALIRLNGANADLSMLKPGYYAAVAARLTGTGRAQATRVDVDLEAIGPVSNSAADSFDVLGQRVTLTDTTVVDDSLGGTDPAAAAALSVAGFADGAGNISATHVALYNDGALRLTGYATDVDPGALAVSIGARSIDYSNAALIAFAATTPQVGDRLTATFDSADGNSTLPATTLVSAALGPARLAVDGEVSLAAYVTAYLGPDDLAIAFVPAVLATNISVTGGTVADVARGRLVQVTGTVTSDRRLLVSSLKFID